MQSPPPNPSSPAEGAIRARGVARAFGENQALLATDLDVGPGGITGLLGPNGSGKSTLLRCLVGLVPRDAGSVTIDGRALEGDGSAIRAVTSYAPGELASYRWMRGGKQLEWLLAGRGDRAKARGEELARALGLPLERRVGAYSHGMKRQLHFAAALAPDVRVRLLDEPTEGLDPSKRGAVLELLREDAARGTTILLSSHHLAEVQRVCHRLVFMRAGRVLSEESAGEIDDRSLRVVRLSYDEGAKLDALERCALAAGVLRVERTAEEVRLHLDERDPRAVLRRFFAEDSLPPPARIEYGHLSLRELYQELYGEEAC